MSVDHKTIAVLMGGPGSEREVSIASGQSVSKALAEKGAAVIDVVLEDENFNLEEEVDLVFNVIHGTFGEDGSIQKILNERRIPYTGAGSNAMTVKNVAPAKVSLLIVKSRKSAVAFPGLWPGIYPPFFFKSSAICAG